jgi:hypothetical protein
MIFLYRASVAAAPDGDDYILILRPEIPVTVAGPNGSATYLGLVDTGSDHTVFPKSIADDLGIPLQPSSGQDASAFGGHRIQLLIGEAVLGLEADEDSLTWQTPIFFHDFKAKEEETVILGHSGFLDYFTATFDGKQGALTLIPNDELPFVT